MHARECTPHSLLSPAACPVAGRQPGQGESSAASSCPVSADERHAARINMPVVPNVALQGNGSSAAPQSAPEPSLSTHRQASTIPIATTDTLPAHQDQTSSSETWLYPSEQQFFNAMKRKVRAAGRGWLRRQKGVRLPVGS